MEANVLAHTCATASSNDPSGSCENSHRSPKFLRAQKPHSRRTDWCHLRFYGTVLTCRCATAQSLTGWPFLGLSVDYPNSCWRYNSTLAGPICSISNCMQPSLLVNMQRYGHWHIGPSRNSRRASKFCDSTTSGPIRSISSSLELAWSIIFWKFAFIKQRHRRVYCFRSAVLRVNALKSDDARPETDFMKFWRVIYLPILKL